MSSVSRMVSMLTIIFFRKVVLESQAALQAKWDHLEELMSELGWRRQAVAAALEPQGQATLAYLQQGAPTGEVRTNFTVVR